MYLHDRSVLGLAGCRIAVGHFRAGGRLLMLHLRRRRRRRARRYRRLRFLLQDSASTASQGCCHAHDQRFFLHRLINRNSIVTAMIILDQVQRRSRRRQ